jgi:hypothetical protein
MDVTKPCKFTGFGAMDVTKPYKFIGFGAMDVCTRNRDILGTRKASSGCTDLPVNAEHEDGLPKRTEAQGPWADLNRKCGR